MKKRLIALALLAIMSTTLLACGNTGEEKEGETKSSLKVGMVTDAGTIDDKSFNQGAWEGILKAQDDLGIESNYLRPSGTTEADYIKEITNLYDTGYKFIVAPGFKFETAIYKVQEKYSDAKFVIIDGSPNNGKDGEERINKVADNTVAIYFSEQEGGFLVGVAAALELKEGELGFIGGMKLPAVQKFNWGFQQGVKYANENLGTNMNIKPENVIYQGTFDKIEAGQQLAATMYNNGVKAIFTAAGAVGVGAIKEAKDRAIKGQDAWIIGIDVDQYEDGIYNEAENKSVVLTSAIKKVYNTSYNIIKDELEGNFPGGETLIFDLKSGGLGIPDENPNLSKETQDKVNEVLEQIKAGKIEISDTKGNLID